MEVGSSILPSPTKAYSIPDKGSDKLFSLPDTLENRGGTKMGTKTPEIFFLRCLFHACFLVTALPSFFNVAPAFSFEVYTIMILTSLRIVNSFCKRPFQFSLTLEKQHGKL